MNDKQPGERIGTRPSRSDTSRPSSAARTFAIRRACERALSNPEPEGDLRAFAVDDFTCVVQWRPVGEGRFHQVQIRLRAGNRTHEHATTLSDLDMLARLCAHHVVVFSSQDDATVPRLAAGRLRANRA